MSLLLLGNVLAAHMHTCTHTYIQHIDGEKYECYDRAKHIHRQYIEPMSTEHMSTEHMSTDSDL